MKALAARPLRGHAGGMQGEISHPCQSCGACCAVYRVSFYWREAEADNNPGAVPVELTEDYSGFRRSMKGTSNKHHCRCVALEGKVGESVGCSIYTLRPSPCRDFSASFEDGTHKPRCDQARAHYKLPPLKRADWKLWNQTRAARLPASEASCYNSTHEASTKNPTNPPSS